jgi:hypothetical protein
MKTNLSFYSRRTDSHRHPKFKMLRQLYGGGDAGWAAEGRFWALNDIIADSELCQLDLSVNRNKADIAETLGISLQYLEEFLGNLLCEDVQLLFEIGEKIYATHKVKDTLDTVLIEREKARLRKGTPERVKSSGENLESSGEPNNKGKERKGEESTSTKKVQENHFFVEPLENLFKSKSKIKKPNYETHLAPILAFFNQIPEPLTDEDIETCIAQAFEPLNQHTNVRMDFLIANVQAKIIATREKALIALKAPILKEAAEQRIQSAIDQKEENRLFADEKIKYYREIYETNSGIFTAREKVDIKKALEKNDWVYAGSIIDAKIQENVEL